MGLLRERGLRDKLLALQFLDAVLHLGDLGFVDFERCLHRRCGRRRFGRRRRLLAAGQPHDGDHEKGQADEKPGLDVLRQEGPAVSALFPESEQVGSAGSSAASSVRGNAPCKRQFLFADGEIAGVDDLGSDVDAVLDLEGDQVRLAVLDFVESGLFSRART